MQYAVHFPEAMAVKRTLFCFIIRCHLEFICLDYKLSSIYPIQGDHFEMGQPCFSITPHNLIFLSFSIYLHHIQLFVGFSNICENIILKYQIDLQTL